MSLFNQYIEEIRQDLKSHQQFVHKKSRFNNHTSWPTLTREQLILQQDTCVELGRNQTESFSFIIWTEDLKKINDNDITLYGKDAPEIASNVAQNSSPFGKIVLLGCERFQQEDIYSYFEQMDIVRFKLKLEGYMLRGFSQRNQEWSRISHDAISKGFNLIILANELIREYKELPFVKSAEIVLFTEESLIKSLMPIAEKCSKIPTALNKIFDNIVMDCKNCDASEVCDEIDALKKLHKQSISL